MSFLSDFKQAEARRPIQVTAETKITEQRAPTDDSVRLLREMEQAAEDKIVLTLQCNSTQFSFTAFVFEDHPNFCRRMRVRFFLGDKQYSINVQIDHNAAKTRDEALIIVRDLVAKAVSNEIMQGTFSDLVRILGRG